MVTGQQMREIDTIVNIIACFLGICANLLLIFLLSNTRVPELKNCSKIILQIAVIDIINSIVITVVMPIVIVIDGYEFFFQNGPLKFISHPWNHIIMLIWLFFHLFGLSMVPVQFAFRYLLLCKNKTITTKLYISLFAIPFLASLTHICIAYFTTQPNLNYSSEILKELSQYFENTNDTKKILISCGGEHPLSDVIIPNISATIISVGAYLVIFYCGYEINAFLKASSECFTLKTAQMHSSLNKVLFFQALTPIIFLIGPTILILSYSFTKQTTSPLLNVFLTAIAWPPFINALFALITLKPLRRKFLKYFKSDLDSSLQQQPQHSQIPKISMLNLPPAISIHRKHSCIGPQIQRTF